MGWKTPFLMMYCLSLIGRWSTSATSVVNERVDESVLTVNFLERTLSLLKQFLNIDVFSVNLSPLK